MSDTPARRSSSALRLPTSGRSARDLYKTIFDADNPETFIKEIPAQSLYLVLRERGLASSTDLIEIAPLAAMRIFLDLDLWRKDVFEEDNVWEWLRLSDDEDPLKFTQKFLKSVDLKLVSWLIAKYVESETFEIAADTPPGPQWYTPDRGYTWIYVNIEDGDRHFLMTRLLALIFETSVELFYQLLAIRGVSTLTNLEEEAFQDRTKRITAEGVPDPDFAIELNAQLFPYQAKEIINADQAHKFVEDIVPIVSLVAKLNDSVEPLDTLLRTIQPIEGVLGELTLIINGSLTFFSIPFHEYETVKLHAEKVKGAINIGLEKALTLSDLNPEKTLRVLGIIKLYRLGLYELFNLGRAARKIQVDDIKGLQHDPANFSVIAHCREALPEAPLFLAEDGTPVASAADGKLEGGSRPIYHLAEVERLTAQMKSYV